MKISHLAAALTLGALCSNFAQANTVNGFANGSFETAGITDPAESWIPAASGYSRSTDAFDGQFSLELASPSTNAAVALQNSIAHGGRPPLTEGDNPILTFQAKGFAGTTGNVQFQLRYLDDSGAILANSGPQFFQGSINPNSWTEITYDNGLVPVGATTAFIEFSQAIGPIDPGNGLLPGSVLIDDLNLSVASIVPEPTSTALLGVCGLVAVVRRRRR